MKKELKEAKKTTLGEKITKKIIQGTLSAEVTERLRFAAAHKPESIYRKLNTSGYGLSPIKVDDQRKEYGENVVKSKKKNPY